MKDWYAIVNPSAGNGKAIKIWPQIQKLLTTSDIPFEAHVTVNDGNFNQVIKSALDKGYKKFIAIGGDGTLNLLVNGICFNQSDISLITLAVIPVGTGNDWIRTHKIPNNLLKAIRIIKRCNTVVHDIGIVELNLGREKRKQHFINIAGCAFDGFVAEKIESGSRQSGKNLMVYLKGLFKGLFHYSTTEIRIETENQFLEEDIFSINIGICQYSGGGMKMVPGAVFNDGLLCVTVIKKLSRLQVLLNVPRLFNGSFIRHSRVTQFQCRQIKISSGIPIPFETDGELIGAGNATIQILKEQINVVTG